MPRGYPGTGPHAKTTPETAKKTGRKPKQTKKQTAAAEAPSEKPVVELATEAATDDRKQGISVNALMDFIGQLTTVPGEFNAVVVTADVDGQRIGAGYSDGEWRLFLHN